MDQNRNMSAYVIALSSAVLFLLLLVTFLPLGPLLEASRKNLLLVTIDTLRADRLGVYGSTTVETPVMDSLAGSGVLYENAFCQVPITLPSHATILTGMYPFEHGIRHNGKYRLLPSATTIAEDLRERGYHTAAFIAAYVLDGKYGLDQGFDLYNDEMPGELYPGTFSYRDRTAREITDRVLEWLAGAREPFFLWVHYFDPHKPYAPPPPFDASYRDPYDGEVAFVDREFGRITKNLTESGLAERTLLVLTSDHGESLGEHGEMTHSMFVYGATTRVPLIMSLPGVLASGERRGEPTELVEIKPLVMDILGFTAPDTVRPVAGAAYAETWAPRLQYGWSELRSIRDREFLFVDAPKPELYDLGSDPGETANIYAERPDIARRYAALLERVASREARPAVSESVEISDAEREVLEQLGYVFTADTARTPGSAFEDPKDMIHLHREILTGWKLMLDGDYEAAVAVFGEALAEDEEDPAVHLGLGLSFDGMGEEEKARRHLERSIELDPLEERSYYALSNLLRDMGQNDRAADVLRALVEIYPHDPVAWRAYARILTRAGRTERAREAYEEALSLDPGNPEVLFDYGRFLAVREEYQGAVDVLGNLIELDPGNSQALGLLGASEARLGRLEQAEEHFRSAASLEPGRKEVWVDLATVLANLDRPGEARACLMKALAIDPDYEPALRALARLEDAGSEG